MAHRLPIADIKFIADFAAFCRTKGDEGYDPTLPNACALAQFGYPCAIPSSVPAGVFRAATRLGSAYTFSALADRLERLITDAPVVRS
jgi:hypothetical protein